MLSKSAVTSMILGIVSLLFGTYYAIIIGIVGLVFAVVGMKATGTNVEVPMKGRGFAIAGLVCSIVAICWGVYGVMVLSAIASAVAAL